MPNGEDQTGATANWRKYPKGPNFGLIVGLSCVAMLVILFGAWFLFHMNPKMVPEAHGPQTNNAPSQTQPAQIPK